MAINQIDIKKLFSRSAGQCNMCKRNVIEDEVVIGEMAHIIAKSSNGPRGNENTPRNDTYDNLILLCSIDHKKVDSQPLNYPEHWLRDIKSKHEADITARLNRNRDYEQDLNSLNILFQYIPFLDLIGMVMDLPHKLSINFEISDHFYNFRKGNPQAYPFWDKELTRLWEVFLSDAEVIENFILSNICGNKLYSFAQFDVNSTCYNTYVGDDNGIFVVMNKRFLSDEQIGVVEQAVRPLVQRFIYSHAELLKYIRFQFKDIKWQRCTQTL
ncbi:TPA: HNH endonuclease signature motif containing protein [Photobacterium damselae]|uniref:HNH endonuclease signature motif containing protein n=1 Tax=Photobacterium damselae TaxID=38293 RepID=UPI001F4058B1|nr:HNH endonuclease signature motif containing protein [Photobacterium damselae]UKA31043.1 HNH endonuclease [Photobacterium damselae subsp. damselae]